jgi:hypothetical protein
MYVGSLLLIGFTDKEIGNKPKYWEAWDCLVRLYVMLGNEKTSVGILRDLVQVVGMLETKKMKYGIPRRGI